MKFRLGILLLLLLSAAVSFGQVSSSPVYLAFPQIAIGGDPSGQNYVTLIQMVNNNSIAVTGHLALFGDSGSALAASFDGQAPQSTIDVRLESGEARQMQVTLSGGITVGWMLLTYSPSDALTTVILQFRSGSTLLSEVGVDSASITQNTSTLIDATDFSAETDDTLNTGIAIANPIPSATFVAVALWDPATGSQVATTIVSLPAGGHVAKLLTELFPNFTGIAKIRAKVSLDSCATQTSCSFSGNPFVATAIRLNGDQFTTIPITEATADGEQVRIFPQVAFGGPADGLNMKTVLYFTTNVPTGVFGTAQIFDDNGNPLAASADGATPASSITVTVPGNRVSRIVLSSPDRLRSGWMRLTMSGSVHLIASAVFQTYNGTTLASEASVLESPPIQSGLVYVKAQSGAANVGIAFANPSTDTPATITLDLFNQQGFLAATRDIALPANGHLAQFVTELFGQPLAAAADFNGALSVHSSADFSVLALRLTADKIATLPVSANGMYRPSILDLRITRIQRVPAQVNFDIDVRDFDSDIATAASTMVSAIAVVDAGSSGSAASLINIDGTAMLNRASGTLSGTFQPSVNGTIPSGFSATFRVVIFDSRGNASNFISIPIRF